MEMKTHFENKSMNLTSSGHGVQVSAGMDKKRVSEAIKERRKRALKEVFVECESFMRELTNGIASEQRVKQENMQTSRMMEVALM